MAREFAKIEFHRERLDYKEERAVCCVLLCLKEEMWKRVCEALYSVALNVLEEIYSSMPRRIADLIKQGEVQRILTL